MIYAVAPVESLPLTFLISVFGKPFLHIHGGGAIKIYNTFCDVKRFDERRADDFMHGVHLGLMYAPLNSGAQVSIVASSLPSVPTWPPSPPQQQQPQAAVDTKKTLTGGPMSKVR